jgi:large subunit ribosomal protein L24
MRGDDGEGGKVLQVYPKTGRIKVDGINIVKKNRKARRPESRGIIEMAAPFHASNVMLIVPRPASRRAEAPSILTERRRVGVKSGEVISRTLSRTTTMANDKKSGGKAAGDKGRQGRRQEGQPGRRGRRVEARAAKRQAVAASGDRLQRSRWRKRHGHRV